MIKRVVNFANKIVDMLETILLHVSNIENKVESMKNQSDDYVKEYIDFAKNVSEYLNRHVTIISVENKTSSPINDVLFVRICGKLVGFGYTINAIIDENNALTYATKKYVLLEKDEDKKMYILKNNDQIILSGIEL